MTKAKLNSIALGYAMAVLSALCMLLLGLLGNLGLYIGAVEIMQKWHMFFSPSIAGIVMGIIEASIIGFMAAYIFGELYNKFA